MLYLNQKIIASSPAHKRWNEELWRARMAWQANEAKILREGGHDLQANAAAELPADAWRMFDEQTQRVFRDDEGGGLLARLMGLGRTVDIGKTVHLYRLASDAGVVTRTIGGEVPEILDKVTYTHDGDPVPIFKTGYGREWREWAAHQSENFNSLADDNEAALAAIRQDMAQYCLTGDAGIVVQGYTAMGLTNHTNTIDIDIGAAGYNIGLDDGTSDDIVNFFASGGFPATLDANKITDPVVMYVSPAIGRRMARPFSTADGYKGGTLRDAIIQFGRISSIEVTFELTGNEAVAFVPDTRYVRTNIGAAVNTVPIPRQHPMARHNFLVWGAMGVQVRKDYNGLSGVFYLSEA